MGKKLLLAGLIAFGAWWHFHGGRQMSEESINAQFQAESAALAKFDGAFLCDQLDEAYRDEGVSFTLGGTQRHSRSKSDSCREMDEAFAAFKRLDALSEGAIRMSFDHRIIDVELSPDRKTAKIEAVGTIRMAGRLISKTHYVDELIRRNGQILHASSNSKSWVYVPTGN